MLNVVKEDKDVLEAIVNKWMAKESDLELMCLSQEGIDVDAIVKSSYELVESMPGLV